MSIDIKENTDDLARTQQAAISYVPSVAKQLTSPSLQYSNSSQHSSISSTMDLSNSISPNNTEYVSLGVFGSGTEINNPSTAATMSDAVSTYNAFPTTPPSSLPLSAPASSTGYISLSSTLHPPSPYLPQRFSCRRRLKNNRDHCAQSSIPSSASSYTSSEALNASSALTSFSITNAGYLSNHITPDLSNSLSATSSLNSTDSRSITPMSQEPTSLVHTHPSSTPTSMSSFLSSSPSLSSTPYPTPSPFSSSGGADASLTTFTPDALFSIDPAVSFEMADISRGADAELRQAVAMTGQKEWTTQSKGLGIIVTVARECGTEMRALSTSLHEVVMAVLGLVESLRSQLARSALAALAELFLILGRWLDVEVEVVLRALMKKVLETSGFIGAGVDSVLGAIYSTNPNSIMRNLPKLWVYQTHKAVAVRLRVHRFTAFGLSRLPLPDSQAVLSMSSELMDADDPSRLALTSASSTSSNSSASSSSGSASSASSQRRTPIDSSAMLSNPSISPTTSPKISRLKSPTSSVATPKRAPVRTRSESTPKVPRKSYTPSTPMAANSSPMLCRSPILSGISSGSVMGTGKGSKGSSGAEGLDLIRWRDLPQLIGCVVRGIHDASPDCREEARKEIYELLQRTNWSVVAGREKEGATVVFEPMDNWIQQYIPKQDEYSTFKKTVSEVKGNPTRFNVYSLSPSPSRPKQRHAQEAYSAESLQSQMKVCSSSSGGLISPSSATSSNSNSNSASFGISTTTDSYSSSSSSSSSSSTTSTTTTTPAKSIASISPGSSSSSLVPPPSLSLNERLGKRTLHKSTERRKTIDGTGFRSISDEDMKLPEDKEFGLRERESSANAAVNLIDDEIPDDANELLGMSVASSSPFPVTPLATSPLLGHSSYQPYSRASNHSSDTEGALNCSSSVATPLLRRGSVAESGTGFWTTPPSSAHAQSHETTTSTPPSSASMYFRDEQSLGAFGSLSPAPMKEQCRYEPSTMAATKGPSSRENNRALSSGDGETKYTAKEALKRSAGEAEGEDAVFPPTPVMRSLHSRSMMASRRSRLVTGASGMSTLSEKRRTATAAPAQVKVSGEIVDALPVALAELRSSSWIDRKAGLDILSKYLMTQPIPTICFAAHVVNSGGIPSASSASFSYSLSVMNKSTSSNSSSSSASPQPDAHSSDDVSVLRDVQRGSQVLVEMLIQRLSDPNTSVQLKAIELFGSSFVILRQGLDSTLTMAVTALAQAMGHASSGGSSAALYSSSAFNSAPSASPTRGSGGGISNAAEGVLRSMCVTSDWMSPDLLVSSYVSVLNSGVVPQKARHLMFGFISLLCKKPLSRSSTSLLKRSALPAALRAMDGSSIDLRETGSKLVADLVFIVGEEAVKTASDQIMLSSRAQVKLAEVLKEGKEKREKAGKE